MRLCSVAGCGRRSLSRQLCEMHYRRLLTTGAIGGAEPTRAATRQRKIEDFSIRVDASAGAARCWLWLGYLDRNGYGKLGKDWAHRLAYENAYGPIPENLQVDHLCGNPGCVNPIHLEAVPARVNNMRSQSIAAIHARSPEFRCGHPKTPDNEYRRPDTGRRTCLICSRTRSLARSRRQEIA